MKNHDHNIDKTINYRYKFIFSNGTEKDFNVKLDTKTLNLVQANRELYPEWVKLKFFKCPNCSLDESQHRFCPIAANLIDIVDFFGCLVSFEEVDVFVESEARGYVTHTRLQRGLSSLIGIYMVTSGCPIMEKLKPMVRHHLPFATLEETKYRVISMYLLAQYFLHRLGKKPDWNLEKLIKIYEDIRILNQSFCKRLSHIKIKDASVNAVVILNCFADFVPASINEGILEEIRPLFSAYLR